MGPITGFEWMLYFVGLSYLIIGIALKLTTIPVLIVMGLLSMFATDILRDLWASSNSFMTGVLIGNDSGFFFWPFFPWFATLIFGFALTHFFGVQEQPERFRECV
ncbi:MAG: heparan-alpha-glucosaminide N-acetyltransferase domain-containing protein [Bdellovibrionota bacterium]